MTVHYSQETGEVIGSLIKGVAKFCAEVSAKVPGDSGQAEAHGRFRACPVSHEFEFVPWVGIPCYAARFGSDVDAAIRTHWLMASSVYYNTDAMDFECTVYDQGRLA